jgi:hypothetical protein
VRTANKAENVKSLFSRGTIEYKVCLTLKGITCPYILFLFILFKFIVVHLATKKYVKENPKKCLEI